MLPPPPCHASPRGTQSRHRRPAQRCRPILPRRLGVRSQSRVAQRREEEKLTASPSPTELRAVPSWRRGHRAVILASSEREARWSSVSASLVCRETERRWEGERRTREGEAAAVTTATVSGGSLSSLCTSVPYTTVVAAERGRSRAAVLAAGASGRASTAGNAAAATELHCRSPLLLGADCWVAAEPVRRSPLFRFSRSSFGSSY
ncbi:uncharacterized protein LOC110280189 [Arachis duranensis]|uniref:Uncharacterized protein LOC110280189 n=1 Tax=Arachis duranensis TaxID=130453 RepID=A0A9C6TWF3_ARADU|nr:uncharacterized protein LOC110280189 [Arachis duranensis]